MANCRPGLGMGKIYGRVPSGQTGLVVGGGGGGDRCSHVKAPGARYREMHEYLGGTHGIHDLCPLRQCLVSSHPQLCGSISNSDLFNVTINRGALRQGLT
jgi:hypothetical protein